MKKARTQLPRESDRNHSLVEIKEAEIQKESVPPSRVARAVFVASLLCLFPEKKQEAESD